MLAEERRSVLAQWTKSDGRLDATVAANKLDVAVETVRRDLDVLQRRGVVRRVHGGAIAPEKFAHEFTFTERHGRNPERKQSVAAVAANFIPEEGAIFVDGGTTTEFLAEHLRDKPRLIVVTNSVILASKLADSSTQTHMLGGRIRPASLSTVGAKTVSELAEINAVVCFIGANGVSKDGGISTYDTDEALVKKTIMRNSVEKILLIDSGKFGSVYPARFADFGSFDRIVTNFDADQDYLDSFISAGVEVALA